MEQQEEAARFVPPPGPLSQEDKERIAQSVGGIKGGAARAGEWNVSVCVHCQCRSSYCFPVAMEVEGFI
eukprot:1158553-Pelagomonas_calceolata.AAC.12